MELKLTRPFDAHVHLRDGDALATVVAHVERDFGRALVMPNLSPPIIGVEAALAYRQRIQEYSREGSSCEWLMSLYLTDNTSTAEVEKAAATDGVAAFKLYPAGATTNSDHGVTDVARTQETLAAMADNGVLLLVHGEVTRNEVDIFDREARFIDEILGPIVADNPKLKVVLEHVTTAQGVEFIAGAREGVGGTITAHHLLYSRNDMLVGGIRPHLYCLPVLKRELHREALLEAATGGSGRFFLGTDSAPHVRHAKECASGCAGCYTSPIAMPLYAEAFDAANALDNLDDFASRFGSEFYGIARPTGTITLVQEAQKVPDRYKFVDDVIIPVRAGEVVAWKVKNSQ